MSVILAASMAAGGCGGSAAPAGTSAAPAGSAAASSGAGEGAKEDPASAQEVVTIQIGFENTTEEPIGKAVEKWAELLEAESNGTMKLQLFPNSALGSKSELIDQMIMGENIITIADGAFYADYGVPDLGILYGPFFFDNWDEVWKLIDSDWYKAECGKLADKGLTVLASNWMYGERELMTKTKVVTPADIKGQKIRLANSQGSSHGIGRCIYLFAERNPGRCRESSFYLVWPELPGGIKEYPHDRAYSEFYHLVHRNRLSEYPDPGAAGTAFQDRRGGWTLQQ